MLSFWFRTAGLGGRWGKLGNDIPTCVGNLKVQLRGVIYIWAGALAPADKEFVREGFVLVFPDYQHNGGHQGANYNSG